MVQKIRKEVYGLLGKWIQDMRRFAVKFVGLLVSVWILGGVLGIGIMGPVYLVRLFVKDSGPKVSASQVMIPERIRPRILRYQPIYGIQANQVRNDRTFRNGIREARNAASEIRSFTRVVSVIGKA